MQRGDKPTRPAPEALLAWASDRFGRPLVAARPPRRSPGADLWVLDAGGAPAAVLKCHRHGRGFVQERCALERWAPSLRRTPRLLAVRDESPRALLLAYLAGQPVSDATLSPGRGADLHRRAGRLLRTLHTLPQPLEPDPVPLGDALEARTRAWCERARPRIPASTLDWVLGAVLDAPRDDLVRVPCHRDFGEHNWLYDPGHDALALIDFEHARPDLWLVDLLELGLGAWPDRPGLEEAFWQGYGRRPDAAETRLLGALERLHAVAGLDWALRHGDRDRARIGRRRLERLGAPRQPVR